MRSDPRLPFRKIFLASTMAACVVIASSTVGAPSAWAADHGGGGSGAQELVREAQVQEAAAEEQKALRLYTEALSLDPTCRDAYLGLAALRLRLGDAREAERVYSLSLEHVPDLNAALLGRARARRSIGKSPEAALDLEAYASKEDNPRALRELARWHGEDGRLLAQLAVWRRLYMLAAAREDASLTNEARTMVRALQIMVYPIDPVTAPPATAPLKPPDAQTRSIIARVARRGG